MITRDREEFILKDFIKEHSSVVFAVPSSKAEVYEIGHWLEDNVYHIGQPANSDFNIVNFIWEDIQWIVIMLPQGHGKFIEEAAKALNYRIDTGLLSITDGDEQYIFPLQGSKNYRLQ